ncbi:MAG: surface antigen [Bacteroidota bacterium]|nr:surface antigen [Bacteroidota bacterium]
MRILLKIPGLIALCVFVQTVGAQQTPNTQSTDSVATDPNNKVDAVDVARYVLRKMFKKPDLFERKKENLNGPFVSTIPYPGYSIATGVAAVLPINVSFYTNQKDKGELSFFNSNFQYNQIIALSISNLFFGHDKWELIGDYRYYNFPTYTFGLGSLKTTLGDQDKINYSQLRIYQVLMRSMADHLAIGVGYHLDHHWHIDDFDAGHGISTDFQRYGLTKTSLSSGLSANLLYDGRDNPNNPFGGFYFYLQFRGNPKGLANSNNWNSLIIDCRKYVRLPTKWYTEFAFWAYLWYTINGTPPYLDLPATGWDMFNNSGRGYALGRFRGLNMIYLETEFRFGILRNGLLGGVVFANIESFSEWPENNFVGVQPGFGIGLRVKLNKRTNTNSAIDYGFGTGGSKGFAFNFNEVF